MELEEEAYVESFRPHIMDVVHAWASVGHVTCHVGHVTCNVGHVTLIFTPSQGAPFSQICKMTDIMEGKLLLKMATLVQVQNFNRYTQVECRWLTNGVISCRECDSLYSSTGRVDATNVPGSQGHRQH